MSPSVERKTLPAGRSGTCPYDPSPEQSAWRDDPGLHPVLWRGVEAHAVNRFEDVRAAMSAVEVSSQVRGHELGRAFGDYEAMPMSFPQQNDPEHARIRQILGKEFSQKHVRALRPELQRITDAALDELLAQGSAADLVRHYALPIPSRAICLILGVPYTDHAFFEEHSSTGFRVDATDEERMASGFALFEYLLKLSQVKHENPGDDLISRVMRDHVDAGDLSLEELAVNCMALLTAGHETTANMIALGTLVLLEHPDVAGRVRDGDPQVVANVTEEMMRYLTIVHDLVVRKVQDDVTIGGQQVRAGERLFMNLAVANRDPAWFEDPDTFDVDRRRRGHVAFGWGIHQCLGQILARAELDIAYTTLLRRLPDLQLAIPAEKIEFRHDMSTYGVHALPVAWGETPD